MFELLGFVVGLGLVAVAPRVPVLRSVTKAVVKGGIAVTGMTAGAVSTAGKPWAKLVAQVQTERAEGLDAAEEGATEPAVSEQPVTTASSEVMPPAEATAGDSADDLTEIKGIGPKAASLLNEAGIQTLAQLAETDVARLQEILSQAGTRYRAMDPTDWPSQAEELIAATAQTTEE